MQKHGRRTRKKVWGIDARAQEQEDSVEYLTPNSLILGRTSLGGDTSGLDLEIHPWRRLRAIQIGVDRFWAKWRELAGPNLFIRHKWHRTERNVKVGDLVWIADPNALRGQFRLGRILTVYPDSKGIVRDADIVNMCWPSCFPCGWPEEEFFPAQNNRQKRCEKIGGPSPGGGKKSSTPATLTPIPLAQTPFHSLPDPCYHQYPCWLVGASLALPPCQTNCTYMK